MKKSLSTKLMYSFMALIATIVIGVTIGMSFLITDYFFEEKEKELYLKGREVAITVDYFMRIEPDHLLLNRYLLFLESYVPSLLSTKTCELSVLSDSLSAGVSHHSLL